MLHPPTQTGAGEKGDNREVRICTNELTWYGGVGGAYIQIYRAYNE